MVFVGACGGGSFFALERETGRLRWRLDTTRDGAGPALFHSGPVIAGDLIITPSDGRPFAPVYALERATGALRWQFPVEGGAGADLLLVGDRVIALTMTAQLVALDVRTGEPLWTLAPEGRLEFSLSQSRPAVGDGKVFFETAEGRLYAADLASGKLLWQRDLGVDVTTSLLLSPAGLILGLADGRLVRLSPASGEIEKALALDGVPLGTLVLADDLILTLLDQEDRLVAVEASLGRVVWRREQDGNWSVPRPTVWGDKVLMANTQG
ncbi:MAG: PQQ-binding-like beta-propeller repeat protein, partial [Thermoanaerobaculia bacterium]